MKYWKFLLTDFVAKCCVGTRPNDASGFIVLLWRGSCISVLKMFVKWSENYLILLNISFTYLYSTLFSSHNVKISTFLFLLGALCECVITAVIYNVSVIL